jgi:hypothetical protein
MHRIREWIVKADDHVGEIMLDAGIAVALAAIVMEVLRLLVAAL